MFQLRKWEGGEDWGHGRDFVSLAVHLRDSRGENPLRPPPNQQACDVVLLRRRTDERLQQLVGQAIKRGLHVRRAFRRSGLGGWGQHDLHSHFPRVVHDNDRSRRVCRTQGVADSFVKVFERQGGILLSGERQEWVDILLTVPRRALLRLLRDDDNRPHVRSLAIFVGLHRWWKELRKKIAIFVPHLGRRRADVRRDALGRDPNPITTEVVVAGHRKFQAPQRRVYAH
jgi:hypothetical protein